MARVRESLFSGRLSTSQADGLTRILDYRDAKWPNMPDDELAYLLATVKWETAHKMQPVREMGGESYLRSKRYYPWVGEGLVQVTWEVNAKKFGAKKPGDLLTWPIALEAAFRGMIYGIFTGKKMSDYIGDGKRDYIGARRIINGTDKAKQIALIAEGFRDALIQSKEAPKVPAPVTKDEKPEASPPVIPGSDQTTGKSMAESKTVWIEGAKWALPAGLGSLSWLGNIPWQNIAVIGILGLAGLSLWTVYERYIKSRDEGV